MLRAAIYLRCVARAACAGRSHPRIRRKPARKRFPSRRRIQDTQTGLRAFTCDRIPFMPEIRGSRYEYEMNVLLECARKGVIIRDVPIETVYIDENASSHFHPVRDAFRIYREIFAFAASSFAGFLVDYGLFSLLSALLGQSMPGFCNVLARIVSASVNYTLNRRYCSTIRTA